MSLWSSVLDEPVGHPKVPEVNVESAAQWAWRDIVSKYSPFLILYIVWKVRTLKHAWIDMNDFRPILQIGTAFTFLNRYVRWGVTEDNIKHRQSAWTEIRGGDKTKINFKRVKSTIILYNIVLRIGFWMILCMKLLRYVIFFLLNLIDFNPLLTFRQSFTGISPLKYVFFFFCHFSYQNTYLCFCL